MLTLYRRHSKSCPHRHQGRDYTKCKCMVHADGTLNGERFRDSLKTRDWNRAVRRAAALESGEALQTKPITEAVQAFMEYLQDRSFGTRRNNRRVLGHFQSIAAGAGITSLERVALDTLDLYRAARPIQTSTWTKELEILRHFLGFCVDRGWMKTNAAAKMKAPRLRPKPKVPYTPTEVAQILAACDKIGRGPYERLRARAIVGLMRFGGLRVSDVATLERARLRNGELHLWTMKTGQAVWLPMPADLVTILDTLPPPRGAGSKPAHFFWSGNGSTRAVIRDVTRTLGRVFELSGVAGAHAHRFRHTLATELMENGANAEDVAIILGISPAIVLRHYAQWSIKRQERSRSLLQTVHSGTSSAQSEKQVSIC